MKKQFVQENQYDIPYHYIPEYEPSFKSYKLWKWSINYASSLEFLLNKISKINFKTLLDIGCGDGRLLREISRKYPDKKVCGIDSSKKAIFLAKALNPNLDFRVSDITKNGLKRKYDVVTLIEVFEHIPMNKCQKFSNSVHKFIKKGGYLLVTVPHKNKAVQQKHYQHFDKQRLLSYFDQKFDLKEIFFFEKLSLLSILVKKMLINNLFITNSSLLNNYLYRLYKKYCFSADQTNCGRMFVLLKAK